MRGRNIDLTFESMQYLDPCRCGEVVGMFETAKGYGVECRCGATVRFSITSQNPTPGEMASTRVKCWTTWNRNQRGLS